MNRNCSPEYAEGTGFILLIIILSCAYNEHLSIKWTEQVDVPRTLGLLLRFIGRLRLALIDEIVGVICQLFADDEGALPWRR